MKKIKPKVKPLSRVDEKNAKGCDVDNNGGKKKGRKRAYDEIRGPAPRRNALTLKNRKWEGERGPSEKKLSLTNWGEKVGVEPTNGPKKKKRRLTEGLRCTGMSGVYRARQRKICYSKTRGIQGLSGNKVDEQ